MIRTTCPTAKLQSPAAVVGAYKQLKMAERAFRTMKDQIEIRPIYHHLEDRVRAHAFLSMLAYYVAYELHQRLAPLLFSDTEPPPPTDPVAPAQRSAAAKTKASQPNDAGRPPRPQPHRPDRRPRHPLPQPTPDRRRRPHPHPAHQTHRSPNQSLRTARHQTHVDRTPPPPTTPIRSTTPPQRPQDQKLPPSACHFRATDVQILANAAMRAGIFRPGATRVSMQVCAAPRVSPWIGRRGLSRRRSRVRVPSLPSRDLQISKLCCLTRREICLCYTNARSSQSETAQVGL